MSNHLISATYKRDLRTPMRKAVLALFADKASDNGSGIYASKQTMADELCCSKQALLDTIKAFITEGLLIEVGKRRVANGFIVEYGINVEALEALPLVKCHADRAARQSSRLTGQPAGPVNEVDRSAALTPPVQQVDPNPPKPSSPKASPSSRRTPAPAVETFLPADFVPEPASGSITAKAMDAWPPGLLAEQLEHFTDHHTARRTKSADWQASWRTWVKNWKTFNGRNHNHQRRSAGNPRTTEMADAYRDLGFG